MSKIHRIQASHPCFSAAKLGPMWRWGARPSAVCLAAWLLAGCGSGDKSSSDTGASAALAGDWSGTCTGTNIGTVMLAITVDANGNVSGTITAAGQTGTVSGTYRDSTLSATYAYADGTTGTVSGQLTSTGTDTLSGTLTITAGGQTFSASCSYRKQPAGTSAEVPAQADLLCSRSAECSGTTPSASELTACRQLTATLFELVPDPEYTSSCLTALSCTALEDATSVQSCLDLDTSSITCNGSTLHGCSTTGKCADISCPTACSWAGASFVNCGYDSSKNHDVCWCGA